MPGPARDRGAPGRRVRAVLLLLAMPSLVACSGPASSPVPGERSEASVPVQGPVDRPLVGVKIYEPAEDTAALIADWARLGIDTAFVSAELAQSGSFLPAVREAGFRTLVITPVFYNPGYLAENPGAWAITGRGERAKDDWVEFVCPSREDYRKERIDWALEILKTCRPDGLSLDFIRHFVFWERIGPGERIANADTACYCPRCLSRFQEEWGVSIPPAVAASAERASPWLWTKEPEAWSRWRAGLITSWVADLAREARRIDPDVMLGVHLVPWRQDDYGGGPLRVTGQDAEALASHVDYLSPMTYAHMLHREPEWIGQMTRHLAGRVEVPVYPSIEVKESYRSDELTLDFFQAALDTALAPPSGGVVFWSWPPLSEQKAKQEILARRR